MFKKDIVDSKLKFWEGLTLFSNILPSFIDIVFKEKWHSIYYRYESARWYLLLAKNPGYDGLYESSSTDEKQKKYFELQRQIDFYEGALVFYNMLIDYSWQLTYFSYEFVCYLKDKSIDLTEPIDIGEGKKILKLLEHNVKNPFDEDNPFTYFKKDYRFNDVIDFINQFWKKFSDSNIRKNYNKIKHCGNMLYKELNELVDMPHIFTAIWNGKNVATDVRDIQESISLLDSIQELIEFDNDLLMPYLEELIDKLNDIVQPAKNVF